MIGFHRSRYSVDGQERVSTWFQVGGRILRHRIRLV